MGLFVWHFGTKKTKSLLDRLGRESKCFPKLLFCFLLGTCTAKLQVQASPHKIQKKCNTFWTGWVQTQNASQNFCVAFCLGPVLQNCRPQSAHTNLHRKHVKLVELLELLELLKFLFSEASGTFGTSGTVGTFGTSGCSGTPGTFEAF